MTAAIVLDTSALIALLLKEPDAELIASTLVSAAAIRMAAPNWLEVAMVAMSRRGIDGYQQLQQILERLQVEIVASDRVNAEIAFQAWVQYGKGRHPAGLNYGDCFAYALAKQRGEALLYKGNDFSKTDIQSALTLDD
jgi:ribonuclease VapC